MQVVGQLVHGGLERLHLWGKRGGREEWGGEIGREKGEMKENEGVRG
jgi:hypothetical protein